MDKNDISTNFKPEVTFPQKVGRFVGAMLFAVIALCLSAILVALTVSLILFIL